MKALVPAGTYAVCTNGMCMGKMIVVSQTTVKNHEGKLIATIKDKPTKFNCVWTGFIIAVVTGLLLAFAPALGPLAAVLLAALAGVIGSITAGAMLCYFCLKNASWLPEVSEHPHVKIAMNDALLSTAQITCTPLGILPSGKIQLFYDKSTASRIAAIYSLKNVLSILGGATLGVGLGGLAKIAKAVFGLVNNPFVGVIASTGVTGGLGMLGYGIGKGFEYIQNTTSTALADWLTDGDYSNSVQEQPEDESTTKKVGNSISNQPGDQALVPPYKNIPEIQKQYNIGTQATGEVMRISWERIKADPLYPQAKNSKMELNILKSKYMKEVAKEISLRNAQLAKNTAIKENVIKSVKSFLLVNGVCVVLNIAGETAVKVLEVGLAKDIDKETRALAKVGIYEIKI